MSHAKKATNSIRKPRLAPVRPPHVRDSPRLHLTEDKVSWESVKCMSVSSVGGRLPPEVCERLRCAIGARRGRGVPLVIRSVMSVMDKQLLQNSWEQTVARDTGAYQVNAGVQTDRVDGKSAHCPGLLPLRRIWSEARRMEVGLKEKEKGDPNPVLAWVQECSQFESVLRPVSQLLAELKTILCQTRKRSTIREPAFVAGTIQPGGGPTHFDNYENLATVLVGRKTFYIAKPSTFADAPKLGKKNERLGVSPHDRLSSEVEQWQVAHLEAGDTLYLPLGWWHFVDSVPHTVMTNTWAA